MILCVVLLLFPCSAAFAWFVSRRLLRRFETSPVPYFATAFLLSLLPGVLVTLLLGTLGALAYGGSCYGFAASLTPCTWSEFALSQFMAATPLGLALIVLSVPLNMAIFYLRWRVVVL